MIVCPVCEHAQASGAECEVCGRSFGARATAVQVARLAELEVTSHAPVAGVGREALAELERTAAPPIARVVAVALPELDRGRAQSVAGPVPSLPDVETGRFAETRGEGAAAAGPRTCRYCRRVQPEGAFCEGCGRRFPAAAGERRATGGAAGGEPDRVRHACGAFTVPGGPCDGCGVFVA